MVLEVKLDKKSVHLLTHTADPLSGPVATEPIDGFTEFVFELEPDALKAGGVDLLVQRIERWLEWTPGARVCAPEVDQLCIEP